MFQEIPAEGSQWAQHGSCPRILLRSLELGVARVGRHQSHDIGHRLVSLGRGSSVRPCLQYSEADSITLAGQVHELRA